MTRAAHAPCAVCLGEAMVVLRPDDGPDLARAEVLRRSVGGAEANVAGGLAAYGVTTSWVSRLGADPLGDAVARDLWGRGVAVLAERDEARPTGLYLKERTEAGSRMHYYRSGSAATAMRGELLDRSMIATALRSADLVHTSGITAGIVEPDSRLLETLVAARDALGFTLSVDLNWRPTLWRDRDPESLLALLRAADVVLLGADEAAAAFGAARATGPTALRSLLGPRPTLVVKSDAHEATEITPDGETTVVPALGVDVVEPVGAGDGFAAGYLAALLTGRDATTRLRQGHLTAAAVLATGGDHAPPPPAAVREQVLGGTAAAWAATTVDADGVHPGSGR